MPGTFYGKACLEVYSVCPASASAWVGQTKLKACGKLGSCVLCCQDFRVCPICSFLPARRPRSYILANGFGLFLRKAHAREPASGPSQSAVAQS